MSKKANVIVLLLINRLLLINKNIYILYILLVIKKRLRHPGIEPGPHRWQRRILTTELMALL